MRGTVLIVYLSTDNFLSEATTALHSIVMGFQAQKTKRELDRNMSGSVDWMSSWLK
jgi:hypothetical protein